MPRSRTILEDGRPSVVTVATAIASGRGSPAVRAVSTPLDSWVIGSGSTDASSTATVWSQPSQWRTSRDISTVRDRRHRWVSHTEHEYQGSSPIAALGPALMIVVRPWAVGSSVAALILERHLDLGPIRQHLPVLDLEVEFCHFGDADVTQRMGRSCHGRACGFLPRRSEK